MELEEENQIIVAEIENRLEEVTLMTLEEFYERLNYDQRLKLN